MSTYKQRFQNLVRVLDLHIEASRRGELATINGFIKSVKFDLGIWVNSGNCGTAACAVGSCMIDPWFKKEGFVPNNYLTRGTYPTFCGIGGWPAVQNFFDLTYDEAKNLFIEQSYRQPTAYNVKRRVVSYMKKKGYL